MPVDLIGVQVMSSDVVLYHLIMLRYPHSPVVKAPGHFKRGSLA